MRKNKSTGPNDRLEAFAKAAHDNGMTYGQLQALETMGKVLIVNGDVYRKADRKRDTPRK